MKSTNEFPVPLKPVLANVEHLSDLGFCSWYEVVYFDGDCWRSFKGSSIFDDGERVVRWKYCDDCFGKS